MASQAAERMALLGVEVDRLSMADLHRRIAEAVDRDERIIVAHHNLHSVYLYHRDPILRAFYRRAHVVHIDGMPLVLLGRLLGYRVHRAHRVTYVDWVGPLMQEATHRGWRVFYLGGRPGVAERAACILRSEWPGLELATHHGYFHVEGPENEAVLARVHTFRPHLLMVGMGMPRQEHWILRNWTRLQANAVLTAGACFDYVAGLVPVPPRWMGQVGLEWLFRLCAEPGRLWQRYLVEPWFLLPHLAAQLGVRLRRSRPKENEEVPM